MKLQFIPVSVRAVTPTLTVHKTGKLGFNISAVKSIGIDKQTYFKVAKDENGDIYLLKTENPEDAVKARKAGDYYYLENPIFQDLAFMAGETFNLEKISHEGQEYHKLNPKKGIKQKKGMSG